MTTKEQFLPPRTRSQPIPLPHEFSDEEMARDWTLSGEDHEELMSHHQGPRAPLHIPLIAN
jgi:hypothetical protein